MMPRFFKDMPPSKAGWFIAEAHLVTTRKTHVAYRKMIWGLRRAYIRARLAALRQDFRTAHLEDSVNVRWKVMPVMSPTKDTSHERA